MYIERIKNADGSDLVIFDGKRLTYNSATHEEELMKSNFIKVTWESTKKTTLPVGAYIEYNNVKYTLFDPYMPTAVSERRFKYEPEFQHPIMWLDRIPFIHLQGDTSSWETAEKKFDWEHSGYAGTLATDVVNYINNLSEIYPEFGLVFGSDWNPAVTETVANKTAYLSFNSVSVLSACAAMASEWDCEFHFDFETRMFHFGNVCYQRPGETAPVLKSGANVQVASISESKENFYNSFSVVGSARNLSQTNNDGINVKVHERLTLDPQTNPDSIIYVDNTGREVTRSQFLESHLPMLTKQLVLDSIYPKLQLYIYNVRERMRWRLDEEGNRIVDNTNGILDPKNPQDTNKYRSYSQWYLRLASPIYATDGQGNKFISEWKEYSVMDCDTFSTVKSVSAHSSTMVEFYIELPFKNKYFTTRSVSNPGTEENPYYIVDLTAGGQTVRCLVRETPTFENCLVECRYSDGAIGDNYEGDAQKLAAFSNAISIGAEIHFAGGVDSSKFPEENKRGTSQRIADTDLEINFLPNYDGEDVPSPLSGKTFKVVPFDMSGREYDPDTDVEDGMDFQRGDYRIVFEEENNTVIPTTSAEGLYPREKDTTNHLPDTRNNIVSLIGVVVSDEMKASAMSELKLEAMNEISRLFTDLNTYTFKSNAIAFRANNPQLHVGRGVQYNDGQDLNGGTSYILDTHVRKLVTRLDNPNIIEITVGNEKVKGTISTMKEQIETIIAGYGSGGGAGLTESQFNKLLSQYGSKLFLSKVGDDTASGVISFLKGALFGEGSAWGYVKQVAGEVRSWFKNLATDILTVTGHVKGNGNGELIIEDDLYVNGSCEFDGNLRVEHYIDADKIIANDGKFTGTITTKNLRVTGSAYFWELIIDKIRSAGGSWLITPADGFEVEKVEVKQGRIRLLWKATDGEKKRRSMWVTGMQAICRTMNAAEGVNYDFSNKYYWSVVVAASTDTGAQMGTIDGVAAHWIEISTELGFYDGSPLDAEVGDEVAQLGFRKSGTLSDDDKAKQCAIYIASYQSIDNGAQAPMVAIYEGIDSFSLDNKRVSTISPKEVAFYATKFKIITGNDTQTIADYVDAKILISADGILSVVNSLPISRNLLLNTDFHITSSSGNGAMHIVPNIRYQGYRQQSKDANGNWVAALTKNKHYILSFYAKGTGKVSALVNRVNVNSGTSTYAVDGVFGLTSYWKRYKVEFDVPNTTVVLGYDVMLGYHDNTGGEVSDIDIMIARPQLEQSDSITEWSGTDAKNILVNSALVDVVGVIPRGWQAWDDGGVPTLREIVPEMVLAYWDEWNDYQAQYDVEAHRVTGEKWKSLEIKPTAQFQGVAQVSSALSGGRWEKVLRHGGTYTLSFFARGTGRADCIVHLMKVSPDGSAEYIPDTCIGNEFAMGNEWNRFSIVFNALPTNGSDYDTDGYAFRVMLGCYHEKPPLNEDIFISRPQLEEVDTATEWHRGEENSEIMSSQIKQTADEISLAVKVDGVKRAGVTLDGNGVTIDGDKLHFNGTINDEVTIEGANLHILNDLDLQGLTTENVKLVERSVDGGGRDITVVNMGVGATGDEVVKSVQVKGNSRNGDDGQYADYNPHIVVLPFYDDIVTSGNQADDTYWPTKNTDITFNRTDGSFLLSGDEGIPLSQRKVVEWRKNGTRVTVTNEVINKFRNWKSIEGEGNADYREADANSLGGFVVVCADGRVLADANIKSALNQFNPSELSGQSNGQPILHGGCFSCMGYIARFIILLPGQSLQLRSQIITIGTYPAYDAQTDTVTVRERKVLTWVVENPTEFVPFAPGGGEIDFNIQGSPQQGIYSLEYVSGAASYNRTDGYHSWYETILAPAVMNLRTDKTIAFWL